ncbi:MAG: hypothetical protein OIF50_00495 [Flavobacteriaceae bacterium]|nr:hypothetical protein [Flavobacteriaceae bacterium]
MKILFTLIALFTFGLSIQAKDNKFVKLPVWNIEKTVERTEVTRVYLNKDYKVIKALNFKIKKQISIA